MSVWDVFTSEVRRLGREERGAALMTTMSVFLLLYLLCAGLYAIGETVRQKIELQNACDSAAYSAAVAEADGLSRMAMINRAMSWTYVQLTNLQIDYITYRWLKLVRDRFKQDRKMCEDACHATCNCVSVLVDNPCQDISNKLEAAGTGWFCGVAGHDMDCVRLNDHSEPVPISDIDAVLEKMAGFENTPKLIQQLKDVLIADYLNLRNVALETTKAIQNTAMITLVENLPRDAQGEIDLTLARDFLGHVTSPGFNDPYTDAAGCFSPLYNTELGERIFLSMADNEVYDDLASYFGGSGDDSRLAGGLDQWFIRSSANESQMDLREVPKDEEGLCSAGICRVYKNANRLGAKRLDSYRDHHHGFKGDSQPSCLNTHAYCPEQCRKIDDSVALYAEYEWSSGRYICQGRHMHVPVLGKPKHVAHFHSCRAEFLGRCNAGHQCSLGAGTSHSRSEYFSCVADSSKRLRIPLTDIEWTPSGLEPLGGIPLGCEGGIVFDGLDFGLEAFGGLLDKMMPGEGVKLPSEKDWGVTEMIIRYSNKYEPNGFSRIYGDDREIYDPATYCGEVAKPWVLNASFYGQSGAIIVGLARKRRNPWAFLLNGLQELVDGDRTNEEGIYSAFDPVEDGWIVAFSAARAAHRFHPSKQAQAKAQSLGYPLSPMAASNEYETRYDAVCEDDDGTSKKWGDDYGRFTVWNTDDGYRELRIGCVCNDGSKEGRENTARFARCWNLRETDWDATLLPIRYVWANSDGESYDSFAHSLEDDRRIGNINWEDHGTLGSGGPNPFEDAAGQSEWMRFVSPKGELQTYDESVTVDGTFLKQRAPGGAGHLELNLAWKVRVL